MSSKLSRLLMVMLATALMLTPVMAQEGEENEGVAIVVRITPKDGQAAALGEAITAYHHWVGGQEGGLRFTWFSVVSGPDTGNYIARSGNHNWADFDAEYDWQEAAGEKFASEVAPHIADTHVMFTVAESDWGIWPENMDDYTLFSVTEWHVRNGHVNDFRSGLSRIDGILKEGGFPGHYAFSRVASGGHGNAFSLVSPRKNFADLSPRDPSFFSIMSEAMDGEEAAREFLAEWSQTFKTGQNFLVRIEPELSDYGD